MAGILANRWRRWLFGLSLGTAEFLLPGAMVSAANTPIADNITPEQAALLPEEELADLVLGNVGTLVLHVERPKWLSIDPLPHTGTPPLRSLTFDLKAQDRWTEGWSGVCQAQQITVSFNPSGKTSDVTTRILSGTAGQLVKMTAGQSSSARSCSALPTLDRFFSTWNGPQDGDATIPAIQQIADYFEKTSPLPFSILCQSEKLTVPCRSWHWKIDVEDIVGIVETDCGVRRKRYATVQKKCFQVTLSRGVRSAKIHTIPVVTFVVDDRQADAPKVVSALLGEGSERTDPFSWTTF